MLQSIMYKLISSFKNKIEKFTIKLKDMEIKLLN